MSTTVSIPLWVNLPPRTTYFSLQLDAERCPSFNLFFAYEQRDICLSPALRPCDFRNDKAIQLLNCGLAEELASYAEPIMQKRYGTESRVNVIECCCPESAAQPARFAEHTAKAEALLRKFRSQGASRSLTINTITAAPVFALNQEP